LTKTKLVMSDVVQRRNHLYYTWAGTAESVEWLQAGHLGFDSGWGIFSSTTHVVGDWGLSVPLCEVYVFLFVEIKRPDCSCDHSPPSGACPKNVWSFTFTRAV